MLFLIPFLFCLITGLFFSARLISNSALPQKPILYLALAAPAGLSVASLILFFSYLAQKEPNAFTTIALTSAVLIALMISFLKLPAAGPASTKPFYAPAIDLWKKTSSGKKLLLIAGFLIWLAVFFKFVAWFKLRAFSDPIGGWDARFFWNVKAKFLFRDPGVWRNLFASELTWSHPDYPLLLPGAIAWGWNWIGKEALIWPIGIAFSFLASTAFLIYWHLSSRTHALNGLLGSAFFMALAAPLFWGANQYADMPLAFFITAAGVMAVQALTNENRGVWMLTGWLAGCAAFTKNEGLMFVAILVLWLGLAFILKRKTGNILRQIMAFAAGLALPLCATLIIKKGLAHGGDYLGSGRTAGAYLHAILGDPEKTKIIAQSFLTYFCDTTRWSYLWYFFAAAVVAGIFRGALRKSLTWLPALIVISILAGYFLILHTSPHEIKWQIQTALERLLLHTAPLALIFSFECLGLANPLSGSTGIKAGK